MHDVLEKYYNQVLREKDNLLFKTFEKFGYSKAKVYRLASEGRISACTEPTFGAFPDKQRTSFMVDGTPLFALIETVELDLSNGKIVRTNGVLKVKKL